ncbi:DUF2946 domain-containing protein [Erwinia sp. SLM-02]|uniref:DUF2946 domain-containing protein n=1 Tax=Erwinia sp. SLM-02 TaxID=3020057 RepID=UPI003080422C
MSLLSLSQRRMPAFIAVLAILMLFIAPEVSKTLVQWRAANAVTAHDVHPGRSHHAMPDGPMTMRGISDASPERAIPAHDMAGTAAHNMAEMTAHDMPGTPAHNMAGTPASGMAHHAAPAISAGSSAEKSPSMANHDALQPGMTMMDDLACGYCELLVHFPFMIWVLIPLIWLLCTSTRAPPVRLIVSFFPFFLPGTCLPRAPPAR